MSRRSEELWWTTGARSRYLALVAVLLLLPASGCDGDGPASGPGSGGRPARDRPLVMTTAWHLADIARVLAGSAVDVVCAVPAGVDARSWAPDRPALAGLVDADLLILNGAGLEPWAQRSNLPRGRLVDASSSFRDLWMDNDDGVVHSHGGGERHAHRGTDPQVWLDPELLALQVRSVGQGLARVMPAEAAEALQQRTGELVDAALALRARLPAGRLEDRVLVATHPGFGYLARRLGGDVVDVTLAGNEAPPVAVSMVRGALGGQQAAALLWERQPAAELESALREQLGLRSVVIDPLVRRAAGTAAPADPFAALRDAYAVLGAALGGD